ncbi:CopD family protein [Catellatospora coxensis]
MLGYLGLLLAAGLVAFAALFLPADPGADRPRRRIAALARAAGAAAAVAWLAALPITAVYLLGGGPSLLSQGATWSSLPLTEYAVTGAVVGGLALAVTLLSTGSAARRRHVAAAAAAALAAMAPALVGHTRAASPELPVVGADALHLLAGSVWLGGLAGLALTLPALAGRGTTAAEVLARFSTAAAGVLAALVATGTLLVWRILGSWTALVDTGYGRLVLAKIAVVLAALAIAAWNRWSLLPASGGRRAGPARRRTPDRWCARPRSRAHSSPSPCSSPDSSSTPAPRPTPGPRARRPRPIRTRTRRPWATSRCAPPSTRSPAAPTPSPCG